MPCIDSNGTLTRSAELILLACHNPVGCADLALEVKLQLFLVRSASRELATEGLLEPVGDIFLTTEKGNLALEGSIKVRLCPNT